MENNEEEVCPLCLNTKLNKLPDDEKYLFCNHCYLIHLKPVYRKDPETEKKRYLRHQNNINDVNYTAFLLKALKVLEPYISHQMIGLDFGCGPNPVLSQLMDQQGYSCTYYDPLFYPQLPDKVYDYIFATECFEHFFNPSKEIRFIKDLLKPHGLLCIMTERWRSFELFKDWYYKRDFTHVSFFHEKTFEFICIAFGFELLFKDDKRIVVLQKQGS